MENLEKKAITPKEQWDNFMLLNQEMFETYDQYMKCTCFILKYEKTHKETYKTEMAKYNSYREFRRDFLIPLFFNSLIS